MTSIKLLSAIAMIESSGITNAINESEQAFGLYQLRQIYIDDGNRTQGTNFTHQDAFDVEKAERIVMLYTTYWCKRRSLPLTAENVCRFHNGGSGWIFKPHLTDKYWNKIKLKLEQR